MARKLRVEHTRTKGDPVKVALAARWRAETTMTVWWIAERLAMGTRGYLNHLLYRRRKLGGELTISRTDPFSLSRDKTSPSQIFLGLLLIGLRSVCGGLHSVLLFQSSSLVPTPCVGDPLSHPSGSSTL
jgi:hypothetical protein